MADEAKVENAPVKAAPVAPSISKEKPKANNEAKFEYYETTGDFQLFDVTTNTTVPHDGKAKLLSTSDFVIRNLKKKNLKKVG